MSKKHFELLAKFVSESGENFKSNAAHCKFAVSLAEELASTNPLFNHALFIMASMPRWMVGTNKANPWERAALKSSSPMFAHGKGLSQ